MDGKIDMGLSTVIADLIMRDAEVEGPPLKSSFAIYSFTKGQTEVISLAISVPCPENE
jgi:hypothetical protein